MQIVEEIANINNIHENFQDGKPMDPEGRIFISDNYVIKIYYPKKFDYFHNELEVYKSLSLSENIPKLFFYGEQKYYKYIIISKITGESLFDIWSKLTNSERKYYLKTISEILKSINNIKSGKEAFKSRMTKEFNKNISKLRYNNTTLKKIKDIYNKNINYISDDEDSSLIHIDTHFYNFMIDSNKKLIAYDFENTIMAPKDYQLVRLYRMNYYPETFIYPKNSLSEDKIKDYSIILSEVIKNYPEIINDKTNDRMKIYLLNYLLEEANRCNLKEKQVLKIICDNEKIRIRM